jgi:rod shape-determining protein MreD
MSVLSEPPHEDDFHAPTFAVLAVVLLTATVAQVSLVARLPLPGGRPDLVLLLLATAAVVEGPVTGALLGFVTGLFGDLDSSHVLGESALVLCLFGYLAGLVAQSAGRSVVTALATVGGAVAVGTAAEALVAALLDSDVGGAPGTVGLRALTAGAYAALLTPFLLPAVTAAARRTRRARRAGRR